MRFFLTSEINRSLVFDFDPLCLNSFLTVSYPSSVSPSYRMTGYMLRVFEEPNRLPARKTLHASCSLQPIVN